MTKTIDARKLEEVIDQLIKSDPTGRIEYVWAIPVEVWCEAFDIRLSDNRCSLCGEEQAPLAPFTFVTDDGERFVGVVCDHLDCQIGQLTYNQTIIKPLDTDSGFSRSMRALFAELTILSHDETLH